MSRGEENNSGTDHRDRRRRRVLAWRRPHLFKTPETQAKSSTAARRPVKKLMELKKLMKLMKLGAAAQTSKYKSGYASTGEVM